MYILIDKEQVVGTGYEYAECLPDGRAILPFAALKVLPAMSGIETIGEAALLELKKKEEEEIKNNPVANGLGSADEITEPPTEESTGEVPNELNTEQDVTSK